MEEVKEERIVPVQNAGLVKRTFAGIVDLFVLVFVFLLVQGFAVFPIATSVAKDYDAKYETYIQYYKDANLALFDEESNQLNMIEKDNYLTNSENYYNVYCSSEFEGVHACSAYGKTFREVIEEDENLEKYVTFDDQDKIQMKDEYKDDEDAIASVNEYIYSKALNDLQNSELFLEPYKYVSRVQSYSMYISVAISLLLVYLLPTMISKKGQTIGKIVFKLAVTNQEGFEVKKSQVFVRFLAFSVINILLGLMSYMLVPLISFTFMIFSKRNNALHDYCAVTKVVDDKTSVIYKNREEFDKAMDKEENRFAEIDKSRADYYSSQEK
ncbi:MAG: RDD family protein [Erysipelotrichales bacterium]|nr:RDD family protein [Erysipelotrichales bacterium]